MKMTGGKKIAAYILAICICVVSAVFPASAAKIGGQEYDPIKFKVNDLGRVTSSVVLNTGYYKVTKDTDICAAPTGISALKIRGDVTIYVAKGVTLKCTGGQGYNGKDGWVNLNDYTSRAGRGGDGGGAGIELLSGSRLTFIGQGTVISEGGNGGQGGWASSGTDGNFFDFWHNGGVGGSGAGGAGGGGAGIGSPGAKGGEGNISPVPKTSEALPFDKYEYNPYTGTSGKDAAAVQRAGILCVKDDITVEATGGIGGQGGGAGQCGNYHMEWFREQMPFPYKWYISGGGGAGGAGGDGEDGSDFGYGGRAGGGGASGNTGGVRYCAKGRENTFIAGGRGGSAGANGNNMPDKGRAPDAVCSNEHVPRPENQNGGTGGKASEFQRGDSEIPDNQADFTPTAHDVKHIKTSSLIPADNTAFDISLDGKIEKKIYKHSKRELPNMVREGYTCTGWFDEEGNKVADETGKMLIGSGRIWDLWGDRSFHSDSERIRDVNYINEELKGLGTVTLDKIEKIEELRRDYDALIPEEKEKVTEYQKLLDAEKKIPGIVDTAVEQMVSDVVKIGPVDLTKEDQIGEIRKNYDRLPETAKQKIPEEIFTSFTDAEKELDRQQQEAADQVIAEIIGIDRVNLAKEEQIRAIREKYESLSKGIQNKIPEKVKDLLTEAEETLDQLKRKAIVDQITEEIREIGEVDLTKEEKIHEIRKKYEELPETIRDQVSEETKNLLTEAEEELEIQKQIAVNQISEEIEKIGEVDLTKESKIREIRNNYENLSEDIKEMIPEEAKALLIKAEEELEIRKQEAADQLTEEIKGIGTVDLTKEEKIYEIRKKYEELPETIKDKIPEEVKYILVQAEQKIVEIKKLQSIRLVIDWKAGVKKVQISWNKIPGVRGYNIYGYDRKTKKNIRIASLPATASSYTVSRIGNTRLEDGTIYQLAVRPHRIVDGKTVYDQAVRVNVMTAPKCVVLTGVKKQGSTKAKLSWKKVKGVSGYQVLVKSSKQPRYKVVKTLKKNKVVIKGLSKKQKYTFKVRAIRKYGGKTIAGPVSKAGKLK